MSPVPGVLKQLSDGIATLRQTISKSDKEVRQLKRQVERIEESTSEHKAKLDSLYDLATKALANPPQSIPVLDESDDPERPDSVEIDRGNLSDHSPISVNDAATASSLPKSSQKPTSSLEPRVAVREGVPAQIWPSSSANGGLPSSSTPEQGTALRSLRETVACLPLPPKLRVPDSPVRFPSEFLRTHIGGSASTFSIVADMKPETPSIVCDELIKVNPSIHEHAPKTGFHGALTFVEGQPCCGDMGKRYPLFWKCGNDWEYGGVYTVARRIPMPVEVWTTMSDVQKRTLAKKLLTSGWGRDLLVDQKFISQPDEAEKLSNDTILKAFTKQKRPKLRLAWTLIQCVGYDRMDYDQLEADLVSWRVRTSQQHQGRAGSTISRSDQISPSKRRHTEPHSLFTSDNEDASPSRKRHKKVQHPLPETPPSQRRMRAPHGVDYRIRRPELDDAIFQDQD